MAARDDRDRLAPGAAGGGREARSALAADPGVPVRALPAEGLPGPEDVLDRGPRRDRADARRDRDPRAPERRRGGRDRDGPPRPAQRPRPQPRSIGGVDPGRVRGRQGARPGQGDHRDAALGHRRRQVPPRRRGHARDARRRPGQDPPVSEPEPPRVRRPGGHGRRPRRPDRALGAEAAPQPARRGAGAAARRRRLPRPGGGRRDAQPAVARRLLDRRHDPPDHRQPGRLHHRPPGRPLDPVRRRHGEGLQLPDHPRQRRRRRGLHRRDPTGDGLPRAVGPRRRHRPDRLPALRPQRDRRARVHAAEDGRADQGAPAGLRDLRRAAGRRGRDRHRRGRRGLRRAALAAAGNPQGPAREDGGGRVRGPELDRARHRRARPDQEPRGRDRGLREAPAER